MTVLLNTAVIFAFLNADDVRHNDAVELVTRIAEGTLGSPSSPITLGISCSS